MGSEWTIETLKEHFEALRAADATALKLQAEIYESRLLKLNGEHAALARMAETYLPREVYERDKEQTRKDQGEMRQSQINTWRSTILALTIALIGWVISVWFHFLPAGYQ